MRTITVRELKLLTNLSLKRLQRYTADPKNCPWFPYDASMSLERAEVQLAEAREKAKRRIARLGKKYPLRTCYWISYVLAFWTWRFAVLLKCGGGAEGIEQQEEVDLYFISALGAEIKRLGFQLDQ